MANIFIDAAIAVLHSERRPLSAAELADRAITAGLIATKGLTPRDTMRARLSEELRVHGGESSLQRTGPNRFALREWGFQEYFAQEFAKALPNEVTVCVESERIASFYTDVGFFPDVVPLLEHVQDRENLFFIPRAEAESTKDFRQLVSYVWLDDSEGRVLSYIRGKYSTAHPTLLKGKRGLGFGGHVLESDADDLFGLGDAGATKAAEREVAEELKGILPEALSLEGVIWDNSSSEGQKHVGLAMRGRLRHGFSIGAVARELSVAGVKFLTHESAWSSFHELEFWSQLLLQKFAAVSRPRIVTRISPARRPSTLRTLAIIGEIAVGKTALTDAICSVRGVEGVSARDCLLPLLKFDSFLERDRARLQEVAFSFITSPDGPWLLAESIAKRILRSGGELTVVEGIRNISTLKELRARIPELCVLYVDAPRDKAFRNYSNRPGTTIQQFAAAREHPVEADLPLLKYEADAVLYNVDSLDNAVAALKTWIWPESEVPL